MNERSPTKIIHGIIEEQEERDLTLMSAEQTERQRKQEATQSVINTTSENYARVVADVMRRDGIELTCRTVWFSEQVLHMVAGDKNGSNARTRPRTSGKSRSGCGGSVSITCESLKGTRNRVTDSNPVQPLR